MIAYFVIAFAFDLRLSLSNDPKLATLSPRACTTLALLWPATLIFALVFA